MKSSLCGGVVQSSVQDLIFKIVYLKFDLSPESRTLSPESPGHCHMATPGPCNAAPPQPNSSLPPFPFLSSSVFHFPSWLLQASNPIFFLCALCALLRTWHLVGAQ